LEIIFSVWIGVVLHLYLRQLESNIHWSSLADDTLLKHIIIDTQGQNSALGGNYEMGDQRDESFWSSLLWGRKVCHSPFYRIRRFMMVTTGLEQLVKEILNLHGFINAWLTYWSRP